MADTWGIMEARGEGDLVNMDWLTMFADYRIPQALIYLDVLRYSDALMGALKSGKRAAFPGQATNRKRLKPSVVVSSFCAATPRRAAQSRRQEGGGDPRLLNLGRGVD